MALKSTIYKAQLNIADMNRHYYADHSLTVARHPSETEKRMMLRLLAFALYANDSLQFTKGLCEDDEPELWQLNPDQSIELWIELGTPDFKRLKKAATRAKQAVLLCYGDNNIEKWWPSIASHASQLNNLTIIQIKDSEAEQLAQLAKRGMQLSLTLQDEVVMCADGEQSVELFPCWLKAS